MSRVRCAARAWGWRRASRSPWSRHAVAAQLLVLGLGGFFRLHLVADQIPLDDEWHSITLALVAPFSYLLTHLHYTATSIPFNVYQKLSLVTLGWSEPVLVLPNLLCGLLALWLFPRLAGRLLARRTTMLFGLLLAVSPTLVFYSQNGRPYSTYVFLCFLAVLACYFWLVTASPLARGVYVATAVLAVYVHLFAVVAVLPPLGWALLPTRWRGHRPRIAVTPRGILRVAALVVGLVALLLGPALVSSLRRFADRGRADFTASSWRGFLGQLSGTANSTLASLFLVLLVLGLVALLRRNRLLGGMLLSITGLYLLAIVVTAPSYMDHPIQMARYCLPLFPIALLWVALGLEVLVAALRRRWRAASGRFGAALWPMFAAALVGALLLLGPLPDIYRYPNNFANHRAFHESYEHGDWSRPYVSQVADTFGIRREQVPAFYWRLAAEPGDFAIVEYPMPIGNHFNHYYYYQHFHRKRVLAGYTRQLKLVNFSPADIIHANFLVDHLLGLASESAQLRFRNLVDLTDLAAVARSGARYVVLHRNVFAEGRNEPPPAPASYEPPLLLAALIAAYREALGAPAYEDERLVVFALSPQAGGAGAAR